MKASGLEHSIPRLASLAELYGPAERTIQNHRYANLYEDLIRFSFSMSDISDICFFSAPGRTELCGNHTDHNNGRVLAAAINLDMAAAVRPRGDTVIKIRSAGYKMIELDVSDLSPKNTERGTSEALIRGIASGLSSRFPGTMRRGFDAFIQSDVLAGSGLSSSAAFEVLMAAVLADIWGLSITPAQAARMGQDSENTYFGKPCGLMDQMSCACGSVAKIDFSDPSEAAVEILEFDISQSGYSLAIVSTGGSHADLTGEYAAIPSEMKSVAVALGRNTLGDVSVGQLIEKAGVLREACGDRAFLRALHFAHENARVEYMADAIRSNDFARVLEIANESGNSSWEYLQNMHAPGTPRAQSLEVALALTREFLGADGACRVHGGGFAGTIQAYVPDSRMAAYRTYMEFVFGPNSVIPLSVRPYGVTRIDSI